MSRHFAGAVCVCRPESSVHTGLNDDVYSACCLQCCSASRTFCPVFPGTAGAILHRNGGHEHACAWAGGILMEEEGRVCEPGVGRYRRARRWWPLGGLCGTEQASVIQHERVFV